MKRQRMATTKLHDKEFLAKAEIPIDQFHNQIHFEVRDVIPCTARNIPGESKKKFRRLEGCGIKSM